MSLSTRHDERESHSNPSAVTVQSALNESATASLDDVVLFDTAKLRQAWLHACRALRRYPLSAATGVLLVLAVSSVTLLAAPLTYQSTGVVSARSDVVSSSIANPARTVPSGADQPLANARETILSESSIDRIIDSADLLNRTRAGETTLGRFRRETLQSLGLQTESPKKREDLRRALRLALSVQIDGGSNGPDRVTIIATWNNRRDATAIVTEAQTNFLQDRRDASLGPIQDALEILERYSAEADIEVGRLREELNFPLTETRDIPDSSPLRAALAQQADLSSRLNGAQIELDAAEAAFKYRYTVVETPVEPLAPTSSLITRIAITLLMAIAVGIGAASTRTAVRRKRSQRSTRRTKAPPATAPPPRAPLAPTGSEADLDPPDAKDLEDPEPLPGDVIAARHDEDLAALSALLEDAQSTIVASAAATGDRSGRRSRRRDVAP